MNRWSKTE